MSSKEVLPAVSSMLSTSTELSSDSRIRLASKRLQIAFAVRNFEAIFSFAETLVTEAPLKESMAIGNKQASKKQQAFELWSSGSHEKT